MTETLNSDGWIPERRSDAMRCDVMRSMGGRRAPEEQWDRGTHPDSSTVTLRSHTQARHRQGRPTLGYITPHRTVL